MAITNAAFFQVCSSTPQSTGNWIHWSATTGAIVGGGSPGSVEAEPRAVPIGRATAGAVDRARADGTGAAVFDEVGEPASCLAADADQLGLVRVQLDRILASGRISRMPRTHAILSFIRDRTFADEPAAVDGYQIAAQVFRRPDYNPQQDAIVRVHMRRLRAALARYYESEGRNDRILIVFPYGSYVLHYSVRRTKA